MVSQARYAVVLDRPYYPSVRLCESLAEAERIATEFAAESSEPDGEHESHVYVMLIVSDVTVQTSY